MPQDGAMPPGLRRMIEHKGVLRLCKPGHTLIGEREGSTNVFLILEGEARVLLYSASGREVSVRLLGRGAVFGELAALDASPRCASVVAVSDLRVLAVSRAHFLEGLEAVPDGKDWLLRRLATEVRRLTEHVFELSVLNVRSRLHCELLRLARISGTGYPTPSVRPAPTHTELANRIGTHREAVTRELKALADRNIVRTQRRALEFLDLARLEEAVHAAMGTTNEILKASLSARATLDQAAAVPS
jgi:CRP/FNR family transcriptional regulator, cyclic AMP receptor protein